MSRQNLILLIEDNKQDELLTLRALKKNGIHHHVIVCRDGAEALDWIYARGPHSERDPNLCPVVTLLDLKLPKIDGHQVLEEIRKNPSTHCWPVVILTTSKEDSDIARSYQSGANSYVQKPVEFSEFSDAIKTLGVYWLLLNNPPKEGTEFRA